MTLRFTLVTIAIWPLWGSGMMDQGVRGQENRLRNGINGVMGYTSSGPAYVKSIRQL